MNRLLATSAFPLLLGALSAPALAQFPYGTGVAGSGGLTPSLSCAQPWVGRGTFTIDVGNAYGGAPGFLLLGFGDDNASYGGLPLYVDLLSLVSTTFVVLGGAPGVPGAGQLAIPLPLTTVSTAFVGLEIYAQAALVDPAGPGLGGGWTATNGLEIELTAVPQVFVACSVGGNADPHWAVNGLSQAIDFTGGNAFTDNVNGAAYTNDGHDLYLASGFGRAAHADLSSGTPVWSWLNQSVGTTGVAWDNCVIDRQRKLLWIMGQPSGSVQLLAIDIDESSATYGQIVHQTTTLSATVGLVGVWGMSNSKKLAAVPGLLGGSLHLVDTDPTSATFLQVITSSPIPPSTQGSPLMLNVRIRFSPDDVECYVLIQNAGTIPGEIARFVVPAGVWLDHNPATAPVDHIGPMASPPVPFGSAPLGFDVGRDGSIYVTGWNGTGFAGRVIVSGLVALYTPLNAVSSLANARNIALNRDQNVLAVAVANPTATILFFDVATLNETGAVSLGTGTDTTVLVWR